MRSNSRIGSPKVWSTLQCYALLLVPVALLTLFIYLPVLWAFYKSLYEFEIGSPSRFVGLGNYREFLFLDPTTIPMALNMLFLTVFAVVARLTAPLIAAKLICSLPGDRSRYFYRLIFLVPILVPTIAMQLIWSGAIYSDQGLLNNLLTAVGLDQWTTGWLGDPRTALVALAFVGFPFVGGFEVLIYYAGLAGIPTSVNEAARLEGCVGIRKFFLIDIPMIMSQIKLILILTIIGGIQGFEGILVMTQGRPGFKTTVPGLWMYYNAFSFQRMGYACAIGVCLFVVILGFTILNMRLVRSTQDLEAGR